MSGRPRMVEIGARRGTLTVISLRQDGKYLWVECRCDCGNSYFCTSGGFRSRFSCKECSRKRGAESRTKHGASVRGLRDPLYSGFRAMHARCYSVRTRSYRWYGAKGIQVCAEWHDFAIFREWALSHGFQPGLTLDRKREHEDYSPDNCEYVTQSVNSKRMRAKYHFVPKSTVFYNEPTFGDF